MAEIQVSQLGTDIVYSPDTTNVIVSQLGIDVVYAPDTTNVIVSQLGVDVLYEVPLAPVVSALASNASIFGGGGYQVVTYAVDQGLYKDISVSAGDDVVIRAIAYSDGTSEPKAILYDQDNGAEIGSLTSDVADRVSNGGFSSDTLWTKGTGWSIAAGVASCSGAQTGQSYLAQNKANQANGGCEYGVTYNTSFTVSNYVAGNVRIQLSTAGQVVGVGTWRSANGTYTEKLTSAFSGSDIYITADADFQGDIDDVVVTRTATRAHPDVLLFTGEAPAGCTTIRVKIVNASATPSTIYIAQVEVYANLITNPSMEAGAGDPWIPTGWLNLNLDAGDTVASSTDGAVIHSGSDCIEFKTGANEESLYNPGITTTVGAFLSFGGWIYGTGTVGGRILSGAANQALIQSSTTVYSLTAKTAAKWSHSGGIFRSLETTPNLLVLASSSAGGLRYADDIYAIALDAVNLTVTPASQANSLEGTGIRIDGADIGPQPVINFTAISGDARWGWTPRHDAGDTLKFGFASAADIAYFYFDADNYIRVFATANNIYLRVRVGGVTTTGPGWVATGAVLANTKYKMRVTYSSATAELYVDGVLRDAVMPGAGINFGANIPTTAYWGASNTGTNQSDAVFGPY